MRFFKIIVHSIGGGDFRRTYNDSFAVVVFAFCGKRQRCCEFALSLTSANKKTFCKQKAFLFAEARWMISMGQMQFGVELWVLIFKNFEKSAFVQCMELFGIRVTPMDNLQ